MTACPHCKQPVVRAVESLSTRTWVHKIIGAYIFGCTVSLLRRREKAA
jgi:hypothetical protein